MIEIKFIKESDMGIFVIVAVGIMGLILSGFYEIQTVIIISVLFLAAFYVIYKSMPTRFAEARCPNAKCGQIVKLTNAYCNNCGNYSLVKHNGYNTPEGHRVNLHFIKCSQCLSEMQSITCSCNTSIRAELFRANNAL